MTSETSIIRTALSGKLRLELVYREYSASRLRGPESDEAFADSESENSAKGTKLPVAIEL